MPAFDAGVLEPFDSEHHPFDQQAAAGHCRYQPTCQGATAGPGSAVTIKPRFPSCLGDPPAVADEQLGMTTGPEQPQRWAALCRPMAERRFGKRAVDQVAPSEGGARV